MENTKYYKSAQTTYDKNEKQQCINKICKLLRKANITQLKELEVFIKYYLV